MHTIALFVIKWIFVTDAVRVLKLDGTRCSNNGELGVMTITGGWTSSSLAILTQIILCCRVITSGCCWTARSTPSGSRT